MIFSELWLDHLGMKLCFVSVFQTVPLSLIYLGLKIENYYGGFYMKNNTDVEFAGLNSSTTIAVTLKNDGKLDDRDLSHVQAALLYTTSTGERRIRVHNMVMINALSPSLLFKFAEVDSLMNLMIKSCNYQPFNFTAVDACIQMPLRSVKQEMEIRCVKILMNYRNHISTASPLGDALVL